MNTINLLLLSSTLISGMSFAQEVNLKDLINKESQSQISKPIDSTKVGSTQKKANLHNDKLKRKFENYMKAMNMKNIKARSQALASQGGSGIGGGNLYSELTNWCDQGVGILDEARIEAQDILGTYNDKISAIRTYYTGLVQALEAADNDEINVQSSITYRTIVRGLNLAQYFGVLDIITGKADHPEDQVMDAIFFLDDYYQFIIKTTYQLDRNFYSNYYAQANCTNCSIENLERKFINYSISQVDFWTNKFIKYRTDNEGSYSTVGARKAMAGLSYLANETAIDLQETLLNNVFSCQSNQLQRLSNRIDRYLNRSTGNDLDAAKLTIYKEQAKKIIKNIKHKNCY